MLQHYAEAVVTFVRDHGFWAGPIVFVLAFMESLALLSLLVPAWAALIGIGALMKGGQVPFWPVWVFGSLGAALGDWLSYAIGYRFKDGVGRIWPLSRHPDLLTRGRAAVGRWGPFAIVIGRFFGPLRASVTLIAGVLEMPLIPFQIANVLSAFVWTWLLLTIGDIGWQLLLGDLF